MDKLLFFYFHILEKEFILSSKATRAKKRKVHFYKGTKSMVIESFDGNKYCCIDNNVYALEAIPTHERQSKNFDLTVPEEKPQKQNIPPMNHPWRRQELWKFVKMQEHHWNDDLPAA